MRINRLTRRRLLQGTLVAGVDARRAAAGTVRRARDFGDSVGVCVHLTIDPYKSQFARFRELLGASGIRHVREELRPGQDLGRWHDLQRSFGIRWQLLASPATNTIAGLLDFIAAVGPAYVTAVEGQNEGDARWFVAGGVAKGDWSGTVVNYQRALFEGVRERYPALPVVSPTLLDWKPGDVALIRGSAPYCDIVALHSYVQHAQEPETTDAYAALDWYMRNYRDAYKPGAEVMVTEAGYTNVVVPGGAGMSENAAAIYLLRLLLNNYGTGILRTFLYEFMDGGRDPRNNEHHYGIVRVDGTPKLAYHALRALLGALGGQGTAATSTSALDLLAAPSDLRHQVFATRDGQILAIWRAVRVWDVRKGIDIAVPETAITVLPGRQVARVAIMVPNVHADWRPIAVSNERITIMVDGRVTLLRMNDDRW